MSNRKRLVASSVLPGFGLTFGLTISYVGLVILIPVAMVFLNLKTIGLQGVWEIVTTDRVGAALRLTLETSFAAALINLVFGFLLAWVLERYPFPGRKLVDGLIDLPFALPTAVAGISLTTLYADNGWIGRLLTPLGIKVAYTRLGIMVALVFVSLPFVVRTVQPVLKDFDLDVEEAAACLGASRIQIFWKVILPEFLPALTTGFALAFARSLGEYGSVVFIAGNMPMKTEIVPLLIRTKLEQFDYTGATAIAAMMLTLSFILLLVIHAISWWTSDRH